MNGMGEKFLSYPGFPVNENCGINSPEAIGFFYGIFYFIAVSQNILKGVFGYMA